MPGPAAVSTTDSEEAPDRLAVAEEATAQDAELSSGAATGPVDHSGSPCPWGTTAHRFGRRGGSVAPFEVETRASRRRRGDRPWRMRPGEQLRLEVVFRNAGDTPVLITGMVLDQYLNSFSHELVEVQFAGVLEAGQELPPGGIIRVCGEMTVPDAPLYSFEDDGRDVFYAFNDSWGGVQVRYSPETGSAREPNSWGGIVRLTLADGVRLIDVCREEGLRAAPHLNLGRAAGAADVPGETWLQVPKDTSVASAVERLSAREDVLAAVAVHRGDPGAEGCGPFAPCGAGQSCCYRCGIPGCPRSCMAVRQCPTNIP